MTRLPLNCSVDYLSNFLSEDEAKALYKNLITEYHIDKARLIIEAGGKMIKTNSFKILFSTEKLIKLNTHPEHIHGKVFAWTGLMAKLRICIMYKPTAH